MNQEDSNIHVWHCGICNFPCVDPESLLDRHFSAIRNYIFKDERYGTKWMLCYDCIIGVVLYQCLPVTLNLNSPFNVPQKAVGSSNIKQDFASKISPKLDLHLDLKQDKNYDPVFLLRMGPKVKYSNKEQQKVKRTPA